ncbi:GNAT family protein [Nonomuraea sp. NPDC005692]|uniref:GNAT family N-acetyltransferase n=1 Tax=Nonomuraea sp. NPDC005692 TaxID=3157168 RepID=UPI00340DB1A1
MSVQLDVPVLAGSLVRLEPLTMEHAVDLAAQGTGINAEAKLLLLRYAFESIGVARVDLKTDARNHRCRRALERLGIGFEGVLRNWSMSWAPGEEGMLRDSAMFAVVASEWPAVRRTLTTRLASASAQ